MLAAFLAEFSNLSLIVPFFASFAICLLILATRSLHQHKTARSLDTTSVQSAHKNPTPRIGGLGVLAGVVVALLFFTSDPVAPLLVLSTLPIYAVGLLEDLGRGVSPRNRLVAAAASSLLAVLLLQTWIWRTDMPPLDMLFALMPIGILFTVAWGAGISHAVNLVDGLNGLASGITMLIAAGLWGIASVVGDAFIAYAALSVFAACAGFLAFNWPFGKIFLGDAGAYSLGHLLAWLAVLLAARNPDVSILALTLLFAWLLFDTFFAIYRRRRSGRRFDQPDRLHFHQLVMRGLEIFVFGRTRRAFTNPIAAVLLLPFVAVPVAAAVEFWDRPLLAGLSGVFLVAVFIAIYQFGMMLARNRPALSSASRRTTMRRAFAAHNTPAE